MRAQGFCGLKVVLLSLLFIGNFNYSFAEGPDLKGSNSVKAEKKLKKDKKKDQQAELKAFNLPERLTPEQASEYVLAIFLSVIGVFVFAIILFILFCRETPAINGKKVFKEPEEKPVIHGEFSEEFYRANTKK